jgi:hypothetical protein
VQSIGFTIVYYAAREEEMLDGPFVAEMQLFNINRDYENVFRLKEALHTPQSHDMYKLYGKDAQILMRLRDNDVSIDTFQNILYLWPAFFSVCADLKKVQDENAELRRQGSGVRLQRQNTDLSKLLTSLSR